MSHPKNLKSCGMQMHDPFLSYCKMWYGANRICYDFVLRETRHLEFSFQKKLKIKSFSMIIKYLRKPYDMIHLYKPLVTCYLFDHWVLSNCYDLSWDYSHAPMIKIHLHPEIIADSYTKSCAQHAPFRPP